MGKKLVWSQAGPLILLLAVGSPTLAGQEMSKEDRSWLENEVAPLMSEDERTIFEGLETDEERSMFKDVFWARRDPTPLTPINEFRDEYEARLQVANRNFVGAGRRGAATDMGRVFLLLGAPAQPGSENMSEMDIVYDEVDAEIERGAAHKSVQGTDRPLPTEGGAGEVPGSSIGLPAQSEPLIQTWVYAPNEALGIPDGLTVRFRDRSGFGYRLIRDQVVEETLKLVKTSYIVNPSIAYAEYDQGRLPDLEALPEPEPAGSYANPILTALRETRVLASDVSFRAETAFFHSNQGSVFVPILFDIDAATVSWIGDRASATVVGLVENRGEAVQQFEEAATLVKRSGNRAVFEMPLELDPGNYTLYLGVRDDSSSRLGTKIMDLKVPTFTADELKLSSVLLFSEGEKTKERVSAPGRAYIIGGFHFIPKLGRVYKTTDRLSGIFMACGFGIKEGKADLTAQYIFLRDGVKRGQTRDEPFISAGAEMAITVFDMPLGSFEPGEYTLRIKVTDGVRNEVHTKDIDFVLK